MGSLKCRLNPRLEPQRFRVTKQPHCRETSLPAVEVPIPATDKQALRRRYRRARRALSEQDQRRHAEAVAGHVLSHLPSEPCETRVVATYLARDGEVDLHLAIQGCWERGIAVAVPVLDGPTMHFAEYRPDTPMGRNRFGIAEPDQPVMVVPSVVLAPLVAFDERGTRLGMGGGYYDRYFAAVPIRERVGVAHECQRASALPTTPRDVRLTAVVTENGLQSFQ